MAEPEATKPPLDEADLDALRMVKLRLSYRQIRRQLNEAAGLSARSKNKGGKQPNAMEDVEILVRILEKLGY